MTVQVFSEAISLGVEPYSVFIGLLSSPMDLDHRCFKIRCIQDAPFERYGATSLCLPLHLRNSRIAQEGAANPRCRILASGFECRCRQSCLHRIRRVK